MSIYGHYTSQYYGNKIKFPEKSFLIVGISNYNENLDNISYDSELTMQYEPDNEFDKTAIRILYNNKKIGYVPNNGTNIKKMCQETIDEPLKIINIKIIKPTDGKKSYGIRVIPLRFYVYDPELEEKVLF